MSLKMMPNVTAQSTGIDILMQEPLDGQELVKQVVPAVWKVAKRFLKPKMSVVLKV